MRKNDGARQFRALVRSHYCGEMQLAEFLKLAQPCLLPMAKSLRQRWTPSAAVDDDDVVQEMMIAIIWCLKRYRERWGDSVAKGDKQGPRADVGTYVIWNMHDKAKKWLHKQRGANLHGVADRNKSRIPRFFDDVVRPKMGDEKPRPIESVAKALVTAPVQEAVLENHEVWTRILRKVKSSKVKWGLLALQYSQGRKDVAAKAIYGDVKLRLQLELGCERDAENVIELAWSELSAA